MWSSTQMEGGYQVPGSVFNPRWNGGDYETACGTTDEQITVKAA